VGELDQAIINIIHNARDILLERNIESPWVMLDIIEDEKDITITIEDNGGGIEENILDKIFEPYFTTRHQYQGTGLGLHMTRKIIEDSLKGSLVVKNTSRGAKFFIKISKGEEHQLIDSEKDEGDLFCNW
jgi:C4-dicarboxylate-specific signal transduction histidine kinase